MDKSSQHANNLQYQNQAFHQTTNTKPYNQPPSKMPPTSKLNAIVINLESSFI